MDPLGAADSPIAGMAGSLIDKYKWYGLAALLLSVLATWGAREHSLRTEIKSLTTQTETLRTQAETMRQENSQLRREVDTTETIEPVMLGGQVVYLTKRTSRTVESMMRQATEQIALLSTANKDMAKRLSERVTETSKPGPKWNVTTGYNLGGVWTLGGGMNIGMMAISVENPVALEFQPGARLTVLF